MRRKLVLVSLISLLVSCGTVTPGEEGWVGRPAPPFGRGEWLNSRPLSIGALRGKVVLVDFWEYTCINCIRTFPYLKEWYRRYEPYGLVIVGVHTPEFDASSVSANVAAAVERFGIRYPVLLDGNHETWDAYDNAYWPREILIDREGRVRYDHAGEGNYGRTEERIRTLLKEGGSAPDLPLMEPVRETDRPGAICYPTTAETYIGTERGRLSNRSGYEGKRPAAYRAPPGADVLDGRPALDGEWSARGEYCRAEGPSSKLLLRYHAAGCYLVADDGGHGGTSEMEVLLDGTAVPSALKGEDVAERDGRTFVMLGGTRLYRLVEGNVFGKHLLELRAPQGARFFSFTFGTCVE